MGGLRSRDFGPRAAMRGWAGYTLNKSTMPKGRMGPFPQRVDLRVYCGMFPAGGSRGSCSNKIHLLVLLIFP